MLVGTMNHPARPLDDELTRIARDFDFVDLTLEPPSAWPVDGTKVGRRLRELGLEAVGHTAYYLPIASPFPELRGEARRLLGVAFETFAAAGIRLVNVHPDPLTRLFSLDEARKRNADAIAELAADAEERGIRLMVENLGTSFSHVEDLRPIFDAAPSVGLHLDVGHANMGLARGEANRTRALLEAFGDRLAHVHIHDNLGRGDLHLPLGAGTVDWPAIAASLKAFGWDGTVALEIFAREPRHLDSSRRLWLEWWAAASP